MPCPIKTIGSFMKTALIISTLNLFSITCALIAGYMAIHGITGWGWFLISAVLSHCSISGVKEDKKNDE